MMKESELNWPLLEFNKYQSTLETLHQWFQIVGKIKLKTMPWQNHSWNTALYVSVNGITTGAIPYLGLTFQIEFDFNKHELIVSCSDGKIEKMHLRPQTVADFYSELFDCLASVGIEVKIHGKPNEIEPSIPFLKNDINKSYDRSESEAIWKSLLCVNEVFSVFRSGYIGKSSPVHFFWGGFDLAVSRYSGNDAPLHPGGIPNMPLEVMQEAYSKEVASVGFWLGSKDFPLPVFYSYIYPTPEDFQNAKISPEKAYYSDEMGEYFLNYSDLQESGNPKDTLLRFLKSTYEAAANSAKWDRSSLERSDSKS